MNLRDRIAGLVAGRDVSLPPLDKSVEPQISAAGEPFIPAPMITPGTEMWSVFSEVAGKLPAPTERTALTVSAIYACVNIIAGAISALPVNIYRMNLKNGERDQIYDDDLLWVLNEQMTARWAAATGWEFLVQSLLLHGDAFAIINRKPGGAIDGLTPTHPLRVTVGVWPDGSRLVYAVAPEFPGSSKEAYQIVDQDDMLHIPGFGFDGLRGLSPLRHALRMTGASAIAMQEFAANFFANSARPDYALGTEQKFDEKQIKQLRAEIEEKHQGVGNSHRPMLLHGGLKILPITMPLKDMEMVATRQLQIEEIARIYGVPPFMIGHNEKTTSWGSGVEAMAVGFVRFTLRQHLTKFQTEMNRKLFRTASRTAEFDTSDLERADMKSLFESLRTAMGRAGEKPLMSQNEARRVIRLKRVEGGDNVDGIPATQPTNQNGSQP
ncbi:MULTISPECIES: phage portal protein [unclassified Rhizobium]|uniref:phage portal protein n=1 Tax=unclassified Rhizobium TaxID=2613769 RepID=UPI00161A206F|nr:MULTISPECIES: phage portal protein [unclassified Rhizobium]MBB3288167.1 HK97 family phage portal protein [Rhizobium sp. BK252]MBB3402969.1 HK97 family phage portal protein [Rhizobium sp. BK289]MBB3415546.1 HK97 family phage portal protein [Rhizobium sp. BK284]MBB3483373.1 HK97 family phage portal protein [Rhizobium sp. BK347]